MPPLQQPVAAVPPRCSCRRYADADRCGCRSCGDQARGPAGCPHRLDGVVGDTADGGRLYDGMCDQCFVDARAIRECGLRLAEHEPPRAPALSLARPVRLGLDGPECRERARLDQGYGLTPPGQRCCCRCGRVTHRVDEVGSPWCGGEAA